MRRRKLTGFQEMNDCNCRLGKPYNPIGSMDEAWTTVTRRRRPTHFLRSSQQAPKKTTILRPSSPTTYAQALQTPPLTPNKPPQQNTQHGSPKTPTSQLHVQEETTTFYIYSPNGKTKLRYPPSPHYPEWWGRCFRCAKKGHVVADCKAPKTCLVYGKEGHTIGECKMARQTARKQIPTSPPARQTTPASSLRVRKDPDFEEFLKDSEPLEEPPMPPSRPKRLLCYFNQDTLYLKALDRMQHGLVVHPPREKASTLSLDEVAECVATSGLVKEHQLQLARLSKDRVLALLPPFLNTQEVVKAIPIKVWEEGYKFQSYSPISDASISVPFFKLWVDIPGVPLELCNEIHMARAVSSFGLYLGSLEPKVVGEVQTWSIFLALDDLADVPHELAFKVGGMETVTQVRPRKWYSGQVFRKEDLPPPPIFFPPPQKQTAHQQHATNSQVVPVSIQALRKVLSGVSPNDVPPELRAWIPLEAHNSGPEPSLAGAKRDMTSVSTPPKIIQARPQLIQRQHADKMGVPTSPTKVATPENALTSPEKAANQAQSMEGSSRMTHHKRRRPDPDQQGLKASQTNHCGPTFADLETQQMAQINMDPEETDPISDPAQVDLEADVNEVLMLAGPPDGPTDGHTGASAGDEVVDLDDPYLDLVDYS